MFRLTADGSNPSMSVVPRSPQSDRVRKDGMDMKKVTTRCWNKVGWLPGLAGALAVLAGVQTSALGAPLQIDVTDPSGTPVSGFRWLLEEDNTDQPIPGELVSDSLSVGIHKSHAPVFDSGRAAGSSATVEVPGDRPFFVSVLPDSGHTLSGARVEPGQTQVTVIVNPYPVPTAQISILAFKDTSPLNNAPELPVEEGLEGFTVVIRDAGGQQMMDAFANPLGTKYVFDAVTGDPVMVDGAPVVEAMGNGIIKTGIAGEVLIRFLPPGKYGVQIIPPAMPPGQEWIQTTTIEGTPTIDAWVKAGEPPVFVEFGPAAYHVFIGYVQAFDCLTDPPSATCPVGTVANPASPTGTLTGRLVFNHFAAPPTLQGIFGGQPVEGCLVGLNEAFSRQGIYAAPCDDEDGNFTIPNIPPGTYQLVTWDQNLDSLFGFHTVTVPDPVQGWNIDLNDVLAFRWFGTFEGSVFYDADEDGFRDPDELGMAHEEVLLRFRDGTIYQVAPTDFFGNYSFSEVFPFFKWLIVEVGFARLKDTGYTNIVDAGGEIPPDNGWVMPSRGKLNPQPQVDANGNPIINPNTGNNLSRTESGGTPGEFLLQAMHLFLGQTNIIDWGKVSYGFGESGGIAGMVYYAVTRAEHDPAQAAAEPWEPGIPRVQVNLYGDSNFDSIIDDLDGDGGPTLADVDNYPLGWMDLGGAPGPEDIDRNLNGAFDPGDALQITYTDSFDDNTPTGCLQTLPIIHGQPAPECFDNFGTWNQLRPGVFDGGFAIESHFPDGMASGSAETDGLPPGFYIVEAVPPKGYETVKEEDKNVDYGDTYVPGTVAALPPVCVGDPHTVPPVLTLFEDINAPYAGDSRPLCDRKLVAHSGTQNSAVEFFMFTPVPKAARAVGFINNDLAAEFDTTSPIFGEKQAPKWVPIAFFDYAGNEIARVYSDEFGVYNALLPSTYTVNIAAPSGVSPNMISFVLNHPGPIPNPKNPGQFMTDPFFNPSYSQTPFTFNFESGKTTYLDTPVIPVAAFAGFPNGPLDMEPPDGTPVIYSVSGQGQDSGPIVCSNGRSITITSMRNTRVPNPDYDPAVPGSQLTVVRDYSFGKDEGTVTLNGVPLATQSWNQNRIRIRVNNINAISTGQLMVTRGDNGLSTPIGITLHVGGCDAVVRVDAPGTWPDTPIQDAIDAAAPGTLILVAPGYYKENPIIYKNVKLQGWGAGSTIINGNPVPFERVTAWHNTIDALMASGDLVPIDLEEAQRFFEATEAPCVFVNGVAETFDENSPGLIDGFSIMGGVAGGGVYLAAHADYMRISNNKITNNQGTFGGGITVGQPGLDTLNDYVNIHHNTIAMNGGINGGGGLTLFTGADNYVVVDSRILGNFSRNVGGGVAHIGLSDGGTIARNVIALNEIFYGAQVGGDGAGIYLGGVLNPAALAELSAGAGSVSIVSNLLQGNLSGSGSGGGICALNFNGQDTAGLPADWYSLDIYNNMIVNNVAAFRGGAIALQDAANVSIIHNTITNNDCTATASLAFPPGNLAQSNPQVGGIAANAHSPQLAAATGQTFSNPDLRNNVIWHNRSFSWDATIQGIVANTPAYWDLQVVGAAGSMDPQYCVLTDTTGYAPTNIAADPDFLTEYNNNLLTAFVLDEGGNAITVRYLELNLSLGDYHIVGASPAVDAGGSFPGVPELDSDIDGDSRPTVDPDIGADEVAVVAQAKATRNARR